MLPVKRLNGTSSLTDFFSDFFENRSNSTTPALNVVENDKKYKVELAAPGMCKDDFKVHINKDGNLVIEMEKMDSPCKDKEKNECKYLRKEFSYSKFSQTLILPDNADIENIAAQVTNGILKVNIPKLEKPKIEEHKRVIEIK